MATSTTSSHVIGDFIMEGLGQSTTQSSTAVLSSTTSSPTADLLSVNGTHSTTVTSTNTTSGNLLANWTLPGGRVECDRFWYYGGAVNVQPSGQCAAVCTTKDTGCFSAASSALSICTSTWASWASRSNLWWSANPATGSTVVSTSRVYTSLFTVYPTTSTSGALTITDVLTYPSYSDHSASVGTVVNTETIVYLFGEPSTSTSLSTVAWTSTYALSQYVTPIVGTITYTDPHTTYIGPPPGNVPLNIYVPTGYPEPAPNCSIRSVLTVDCGKCTLTGGTVDLLWWPPATSSAFNGSSNATAATRTAVISGRTYTSPTVYVSINSVYASDSCSPIGHTYSNVILSLASADISTVYGWTTDPYAPRMNDPFATLPNGPVNPAGARPLNYSDIMYPPLSIYEDQPSCIGFCATVLPDYKPILAIPEGLRDMDPAWASCGIGLQGYYDPPIALQPASVIAGPTTLIAPTTTSTEPPTPGGSTDNGIASRTTLSSSVAKASTPDPAPVVVDSTLASQKATSTRHGQSVVPGTSVNPLQSTGMVSSVANDPKPSTSEIQSGAELSVFDPATSPTVGTGDNAGTVDSRPSSISTDSPQPKHVDSTQANPTQANPTQANPTHARPTHVNPTHVALTQADPTHADPMHIDLTHADPIHTDPTHADSANTGSSDSFPEPAKASTTAVSSHSMNAFDVLSEALKTFQSGSLAMPAAASVGTFSLHDTILSVPSSTGDPDLRTVVTVGGDTFTAVQGPHSTGVVLAASGTTLTVNPSSVVSFQGQALWLDPTEGLLVNGGAVATGSSGAISQATSDAIVASQSTTTKLEAALTIASATLTAASLADGVAIVEEGGTAVATLTSGGSSAVISGGTVFLGLNGLIAGASTATFSTAVPSVTGQMATFTANGQIHTASVNQQDTAIVVVDGTITVTAGTSAGQVGGITIGLESGSIVIPTLSVQSNSIIADATPSTSNQETTSPAGITQQASAQPSDQGSSSGAKGSSSASSSLCWMAVLLLTIGTVWLR